VELGELHVVILHFPIVLFWTGLVFDLLGWIWKCQVYPTGHWIIIAAALLAIPTVLTGLEAADAFPGNPAVILHRNMALITLAVGFCHAVLRLYLVLKKKTFRSSLLVFFSLINVLLVSITAEFGGVIAFGKGILIKSP
jgi:uncharacterized membrane protein